MKWSVILLLTGFSYREGFKTSCTIFITAKALFISISAALFFANVLYNIFLKPAFVFHGSIVVSLTCTANHY